MKRYQIPTTTTNNAIPIPITVMLLISEDSSAIVYKIPFS